MMLRNIIKKNSVVRFISGNRIDVESIVISRRRQVLTLELTYLSSKKKALNVKTDISNVKLVL